MNNLSNQRRLMSSQLILGMLFAFCVFTYPQYSHAQQKSLDANSAERQLDRESDFDGKVQKLIGQTFWLKPNLKAIGRVVFFVSPSEDSASFTVDKETSFVATGAERTSHFKFLKVVFPDGNIGYLQLNWANIGNTKIDKPIEFLLDEKTIISETIDYIFPTLPKDFMKSYLAKRLKEKQEFQSKPSPRIGMTTAQVLASSWGKPESINTTITANGNSEQWVYGLRTYVYFRNGKVSAIQY